MSAGASGVIPGQRVFTSPHDQLTIADFSKIILRSGSGHTSPKDGDMCWYRLARMGIEAMHEEEKHLWSYSLGYHEVFIGSAYNSGILAELFDDILCTMKRDEECCIKFKYDLSSARPQRPTTELKFYIRLVHFKTFTFEERLEKGIEHAQKGNALYNKCQQPYMIGLPAVVEEMLWEAIQCYETALVLTKGSGLDTVVGHNMEPYDSLIQQCHVFLAATYRKRKSYIQAIKHCKIVLNMDKSAIDALLYRGYAYMGLERWHLAEQDFESILKRIRIIGSNL